MKYYKNDAKLEIFIILQFFYIYFFQIFTNLPEDCQKNGHQRTLNQSFNSSFDDNFKSYLFIFQLDCVYNISHIFLKRLFYPLSF